MRRRYNGSVQSSNTPVYGKSSLKREDHTFYRCMVVAVVLADDPENVTKNAQNPEVVYDVVILGGPESGQTLPNVRLGSTLSGDTNYSERILRASTKDVTEDPLHEHDGDIVGVQFIQGNDSYPVIICLMNGISSTVGTTSADSPRFIEQYNGVQTLIDNKGNFTFKRFGGSTSEGRFTPETEENVTFEVTDTGLKFTTKGGITAEIVDSANTISIKAGSTEILVDGSSGKISLKGDMVELGSSVSDFVTMFTQLASAFNSHIHLVPQAPAGTLPSMPPSAPLLSSVGSQTVKVQS